MIISNCPKHVIQQAVAKLDLRAEIESFSPNRHRVKLYPSSNKSRKVEAGEQVRYSANAELRAKLREAYAALGVGVPEEFGRLDPAEIPAATWEQARKMKWLILGRFVPKYKKIARYQRKGFREERAICALCWHGFRDFFYALFDRKPDAVARTAFATYRGREGFKEEFPETAHRNIGSTYNPVLAHEACFCDSDRSVAPTSWIRR